MASTFRFHGRHLLQLVFFLLAVAMLSQAEAGGRGGGRRFLLETSSAPPSPREQFLRGHNEARRAVKVGPVRWSPELAARAGRVVRYQREKKGCGFANLQGKSSGYGANQFWSSYPARPEEVVQDWVENGKYYEYGNNSCAEGHGCGTYTQVVWKRTSEVGCAQATCVGGATLTVCLYFPPGNYLGEKPY